MLLSFSVIIFPQIQFGTPIIKNYQPKDYKAHTQNRAITIDNHGIMYFGNSAGILEFDGWSILGQQFTNSEMTYDFTNVANKTFDDNMIQLGSKWSIYSGDVSDGLTAGNQDGYIDIFDDSIVYNNSYNGVTVKYPGFPVPMILKKDMKRETNKEKININ